VAPSPCGRAEICEAPSELDGDQHGEEQARRYDDARTRWLETAGFHVLRFWNREFFQDRNEVVETIARVLKERAPHFFK
jgi:very-short-patch-repair endonuclease